MPHIFVPPPASWSFDIPARLRVSIGDAIAIFSRIDHAIIEILWVNEQADLARKRIIAKRSANNNIKQLKAVVETLPVDTRNIWDALDRLRNDRNIIGHSVWMIDDKFVPWAVWHSQFLESDDHVVGEQFNYGRFTEMMTIARHLLETLLKFKTMLDEIATPQKAGGNNAAPLA